MVVIRLARRGAKKKPFYDITVADKRAKRDGRFIEQVGFFNPVARGQEQELCINWERIQYWQSNGAQPSEVVASLLRKESKRRAAEQLATEA